MRTWRESLLADATLLLFSRRVCVGPGMSWLNFVGRRPFPVEDGEDTISRVCPIGERLTNLLQNHSAVGFGQVNDQREGFSHVTLSDVVFFGEALDGRPSKGFVVPPWSGSLERDLHAPAVDNSTSRIAPPAAGIKCLPAATVDLLDITDHPGWIKRPTSACRRLHIFGVAQCPFHTLVCLPSIPILSI